MQKRLSAERNDKSYAILAPDDKAIIRDLYEKKVASGTYQFREAVQDSMLSLRRFQEMIAKATGKPIKDYENAYMAENQLSSINKQEQDLFIKELFVPLIEKMLSTCERPAVRYFQHFKGGKYRYITSAFDSETKERMVVYQALYGEHGTWVRPEKMFFEKVTRDGMTFSRFTEIDGNEL